MGFAFLGHILTIETEAGRGDVTEWELSRVQGYPCSHLGVLKRIAFLDRGFSNASCTNATSSS